LIEDKGRCVGQCPDNTKLNQSTNSCEEECILGYFEKDIGVLAVLVSINKLFYNNKCVDVCPTDTQQIDSFANLISL
jgi:hypothetical protein